MSDQLDVGYEEALVEEQVNDEVQNSSNEPKVNPGAIRK